MRLICPNCRAQYEVSAHAIAPEGREVECSACGTVWFQPGSAAVAAPKPQAPLEKPVTTQPAPPRGQDHIPTPAAKPAPARTAPEPAMPRRPADVLSESARALLLEELAREQSLRQSGEAPVVHAPPADEAPVAAPEQDRTPPEPAKTQQHEKPQSPAPAQDATDAAFEWPALTITTPDTGPPPERDLHPIARRNLPRDRKTPRLAPQATGRMVDDDKFMPDPVAPEPEQPAHPQKPARPEPDPTEPPPRRLPDADALARTLAPDGMPQSRAPSPSHSPATSPEAPQRNRYGLGLGMALAIWAIAALAYLGLAEAPILTPIRDAFSALREALLQRPAL